MSSKASTVVLDIDRTLTSGTAWFRVLADPDGPLSEARREAFTAANAQCYGPAPTMTEADFRAFTLALLSDQGLALSALREAGRAAIFHVTAYIEAMAYLRALLWRQEEFHVVFLTAGVRPFMEGVVEAVLRAHQIGPLSYEVVGTEIYLVGGRLVERRHLGREEKCQFIRDLLDSGTHIRLLADDDHHASSMFDDVEDAGGSVVRVVHESPKQSNASWRAALAKIDPDAATFAQVLGSSDSYGIEDIHVLLREHRAWFQNLPPSSSPIGVGEMTENEFRAACSSLQSRTGTRGKTIVDAANHLTVRRGHLRMLRGCAYYLGVPPYLFADVHTSIGRWELTVSRACGAVEVLEQTGLLTRDGWASLPLNERWVILTILDHLRNAATQALDALVRSTTALDNDDGVAAVESVFHDSHRAYWGCITNHPVATQGLAHPSRWSAARKVLAAGGQTTRVRELDDPFMTLLIALSVRKQLASADISPAGIVDFASGALDLGIAVLCVAPDGKPRWDNPRLTHLAFSSKRRHATADDRFHDSKDVWRHTHPVFRSRLDHLAADGGAILLLDNNVATFETLATAKRVIARSAHGPVLAAAGCVYASNIVAALTGRPHEPLVDGWRKVLDLRPVGDYVTAFDTWGTSMKTRELDRIYTAVPACTPTAVEVSQRRSVLKICRVHNAVDAAVAVHAGANWIGIHAVSAGGEQYEADQQLHEPLRGGAIRSYLPVSSFEVESVRQMVRAAPSNLTVVLVVEDPLHPSDIAEVARIYDLPEPYRLQLQCRVTVPYLRELHATGAGLICAVGADQEDAVGYVAEIAGGLREDRDVLMVDFSTHQPDLIAGRVGSSAPLLPALAAALARSRMPVLVASDQPPAELTGLAHSFSAAGVRVIGVDTQNAVEAAKGAQRYRWIGPAAQGAQALIRKVPDLMSQWRVHEQELERIWSNHAAIHR